jgi:hypothetical protein
MTAPSAEPVRWNRARWVTAIGVLFLLQLGAAYWLGERSQPRPRAAVPSTEFHLLLGSAHPPETWHTVLTALDPTRLALLHTRPPSPTFERAGSPQVETTRDLQLPSAPAWIPLRLSSLDGGLPILDATNLGAPALETAPAAALPRLSAPAPMPFQTQSVWSVEGDLARRPVLAGLSLPSVPHTEVLSNSVIQLAVTDGGVVFSHALLGSSGAPAADQLALAQCRELRFAPRPIAPGERGAGPPQFEWGRLIVQWHILPLAPEKNQTP